MGSFSFQSLLCVLAVGSCSVAITFYVCRFIVVDICHHSSSNIFGICLHFFSSANAAAAYIFIHIEMNTAFQLRKKGRDRDGERENQSLSLWRAFGEKIGESPARAAVPVKRYLVDAMRQPVSYCRTPHKYLFRFAFANRFTRHLSNRNGAFSSLSLSPLPTRILFFLLLKRIRCVFMPFFVCAKSRIT